MKSIEILERIFGSIAKVKIMRLFLFNSQVGFKMDEVIRRAKVSREVARKELKNLEKVDLLKRRSVRRKPMWSLDPKFLYIRPLKEFLVEMGPIKHSDIANRLRRVGKMKLIVVAGVFVHDQDSRVDLLVVGDKIRKKALDRAVRTMESEIGKELSYAVFETPEFTYRLDMYDKLLRDILDYPHQKIINKFGDLN